MADGKIKYEVDIDNSTVESQINETNSKIEKHAKSGSSSMQEIWTGACRAVGEAFLNLAVQAGQAVAGFVKDVVSTGAEFESGMSQVAATLGYSADEIANNTDGAGDAMDALTQKAKEMGAATNFSASEAAEGLNILAMSGYDAESSIGMIEDVLHLAAAGSMDMASAAGYISTAMKGFGDETKTSGYYADLMAKGATLANTSVAQLGEAMAEGAATAASYGQNADTMTIALLRLAEQGSVGSAAGTELAAAMKNLYAPTDQAAAAMEELGVSAFDEAGNARDFNDVVNELAAAMSSMTDAERTQYAQTIFGIQGFSAYNKMIATSTSKQKDWEKALSESTGEAANQYETMTDNLQGQIDIMNSAMDGFKIALYENMGDPVKDIVSLISDGFSNMTTAFEEGGFVAMAQVAGELIGQLGAAIIEALPTLIEVGMQLIVGILEGITSSLPQIGASITNVITTIVTSLVESFPSLMETGIQILTTVLKGIVDAIPQLVAYLPTIITTIVNTLIGNIGEIITSGLEIVLALIEGLVGALPDLIAAVPEIIVSIVTTLLENLPTIIEASIEIIVAIITGLIQALPDLVAALPEIIDAIITAFADVDWGELGWNLIEGITTGVVDAAVNLVTAVVNAVSNAIDTVKGWLGIASPSKKMKQEVGVQMVAGETEGIEDETPDLVKQVKTTQEQAYEASLDYGTFGTPDLSAAASEGMGAGVAGMNEWYITVPLYLDGKEIARATAWDMGEQLAWEARA